MSIGVQFCCDDMKYYVGHSFLYYNEVFDEYGIQCLEDGGALNIEIRHCPWCGKKLSLSQREKWFDELAEKGFDEPIGDDTIPDEYKSQKWRTRNNADRNR